MLGYSVQCAVIGLVDDVKMQVTIVLNTKKLVGIKEFLVEGSQSVGGLRILYNEGDVCLAGSLTHHLDVDIVSAKDSEDSL